ncbi:FCD domain-containing protein, partial [Pseudomonas sp. NFACC16-2]
GGSKQVQHPVRRQAFAGLTATPFTQNSVHPRDLVFHRLLVDAAHNPALSELYRYFSSVIGAQLRQSLNISPRHQHVFDLHVEILDAVEQQDPQRAKSLCRQLINEP